MLRDLRNEQRKLILIEQARKDYREHRGKVLLASVVDVHDGDELCMLYCDPPAKVRVCTDTEDGRIARDMGDAIDPIWDVELIESRPDIQPDWQLFVYGICYDLDGKIDHEDWVLADAG